MNFFVVFQNQTYVEEKKGQYLWAPQKNKNNKSLFYWESMKKIQPGDIIFSMYRQHLYSVNIATKKAVDATNPFEELGNSWGRVGWLVKAEYNELAHPVSIKAHQEEILKLCPPKYSPFTKKGGGTQGYLFEIDEDFGEYFLKLVREKNKIEIKRNTPEEEEVIKSTDDLINQVVEATEKEIIVKARIGQGIFKKKLLERSSKCEICGLDIPALLIASHCKPWSESEDKERLDPNNGLLLCTNHDGVFDKGLISFNEDGSILISDEIGEKNYNLLNLNSEIKIHIRSAQREYLKWHKENKLY